jgi:hypothetical protein
LQEKAADDISARMDAEMLCEISYTTLKTEVPRQWEPLFMLF